MAEANQTVLKVLNHLNSKIGTGGVVDSWSDGQGNFWRKYADGWIEQGGKIASVNRSTISFNTSFSDTNYTIVFAFSSSDTGDRYHYAPREMKNSRTTSSVDVYVNDAPGSYFACGY